MASITVQEYLRKKALGISGGLIVSDLNPAEQSERLTFINNLNESKRLKLRAYNIWYTGDSQELLNFYSRAMSIDANYDPIYNRNIKSYFWSESATEEDIKRTHSGQPRNIVDTLTNIVGIPKIGVAGPGDSLSVVDKRLQKILYENNFNRLLLQKSRPYTLVEGWGAWKINWDKEFSDTPILMYYRADSVDFIEQYGRIIAIVYRDYYQDDKKNDYVLFETRRLSKREFEGKMCPCLFIEKDLFKMTKDADTLIPCKLTDLKQLRDVKETIVIDNFRSFLGAPSVFYEDPTGDMPGRSIFTGKLDLFDDLDQCHSQSANAVRRSTVHEYFDVNYVEKDQKTGIALMPNDFDRKYIMFKGSQSGDGSVGNGPVQVTQPAINFTQYDMEEQNILIHIISGIMSPATLGIDIAKKDNAEAQREKEKVTIFTRNCLMFEEEKTLKMIANDLLCADEIMHSSEGDTLTCSEYSVYVKYDEFADASYEAKLNSVLMGWQAGFLSDEMAIETFYKDSVTPEIKARELKFLEEDRKQQQQSMPNYEEQLGQFGELGAENEYNEAHEDPSVLDRAE